MDRRRHRRAWRSARPDPAQPRPRRCSRGHRRGPPFPRLPRPPDRLAANTRRPRRPMRQTPAARRLLRHDAADRRHPCRSLSRRTRHHRAGSTASLALPPVLLLPPATTRTRSIWPALLAAVTDARLHRPPASSAPGSIPTARQGAHSRSAPGHGHLLGNGVRIGFDRAAPPEVIAAGEGVETMLALRQALPRCRRSPRSPPTTSPPSILPPTLRRLYIATRQRRRAGHGRNGCGTRPRRRNRGRAAPARPRRFQRRPATAWPRGAAPRALAAARRRRRHDSAVDP